MNLLPGSVSAVIADYREGKLQRDEFWKTMQQSHLALLDYSALIEGGNIRRIEIEPSGLYLVFQSGIKMAWNPNELRTAQNVSVNHKAYEAEELAMIERIAQSSKIVFDIGANTGWYTLHIARQVQKNQGAVYAFEPVPQTFQELKKNIELNETKEVIRPFNVALGENEGVVQFYVPEFSGSVAASQRPLFPDDRNRVEECRLTTLDQFCQEQQVPSIDFIKCDVEGSELFVVRGGLKTIEQHRPVIMLEMLRKWARAFDYHPNDIIALLRERGYGCWSYEEDHFTEIAEVTDNCTQTNFFFLDPEKHNWL